MALPHAWAVPPPIRHLFNLFPLSTLPPEPLPARSPSPIHRPRLYIYAHHDDGRPSFNPSCLKYQTLLRIAGIDVDLVPSNNHASPSGSLPFLCVPAKQPLTGDRITAYASTHSALPLDAPHPRRAETYAALLAQNIRPLWLYTLYLLDANLPLLTSLYLPSSRILRPSALRSIRHAATAEILKTCRTSHISPSRLLDDALDALRALSLLLADDDWFLGSPAPTLLDAELFAYSHIALDDALPWRSNPLAEALKRFDNLVAHRKRLYERCWPEGRLHGDSAPSETTPPS